MFSKRRRMLLSVAIFAFTYVALNLPPRAFGRSFCARACELANASIGGVGRLRSDLALHFEPANPNAPVEELSVDIAWTAALYGMRLSTGERIISAANLRRNVWVPVAVFSALVLTSSIWHGVRSLLVLVIGVIALQIPMLFALAMQFMGALHEHYVIDLSESAQAAVRFTHGVLDPPGVVYSVPLLLWAALTFATRRRQELPKALPGAPA